MIVLLAVLAARRGRRTGGQRPPEGYYGGNALVHAGRPAGTVTVQGDAGGS